MRVVLPTKCGGEAGPACCVISCVRRVPYAHSGCHEESDSSPRCICPGRRRVPRRAVGCAGQTLQLTRRPQKQRSKRSSASVAPKRWFSWINVLFARMMRDGLNATVVARSSAPTVRSPPSAVRAPGLVRICRAHQPSPRPCYSCNRTVTAPKAKLGCGRHGTRPLCGPSRRLNCSTRAGAQRYSSGLSSSFQFRSPT